MNWDDLKIVAALADHGSVQRASQALNVNPSTVTRRLAQLETDLRATLFARFRTGYELTEVGHRLISRIKNVQVEVAAIEQDATAVDETLAGPIRVTAPATLVDQLLGDTLLACAVRHPSIELRVCATDSIASLTMGEADIAVRITRRPPETLIGRPVCKTGFAAYASKAFVSEHRHERAGQPVDVIGEIEGDSSTAWLRTRFGETRVALRSDTVAFAMQACAAGVGVARLPCFCGDRHPALLRLGAPVEDPPGLWVLSHPRLRSSARIRTVAAAIQQSLQEHRTRLEGRP